MACRYYLHGFGRCKKGLPITSLYSEYFCRGRPEKCPVYNIARKEVISGRRA